MDLGASLVARRAPCGPVELPNLDVLSDDASLYPLGARVSAPCAPAPSDLDICGIPRYTLPIGGYCFECTVRSRDGQAPPEHLEALLGCLEQHLSVTGGLDVSDDGGVREIAPLRWIVSRNPTCVRVRFAPIRFASVHSIRIDCVTLANDPIPSPSLPRRVLIGACHDPSPAGDVWNAAYNGDVPALLRALQNGCSTEERLLHAENLRENAFNVFHLVRGHGWFRMGRPGVSESRCFECVAAPRGQSRPECRRYPRPP